jgi:hypothetical protein
MIINVDCTHLIAIGFGLAALVGYFIFSKIL